MICILINDLLIMLDGTSSFYGKLTNFMTQEALNETDSPYYTPPDWKRKWGLALHDGKIRLRDRTGRGVFLDFFVQFQ